MPFDGERTPVGYVRWAHGIVGAALVRPLTDAPGERFVVGAVFETDEAPARTLVVTEVRPHRGGLLLSFDRIDDRNQAEALRGVTLTIASADRRLLQADEFWEENLTGLEAVDVEGNHLGTVACVVFGPTQDRLVIATGEADHIEVPFVSDIVPEVRPGDGVVVINPPEGLF